MNRQTNKTFARHPFILALCILLLTLPWSPAVQSAPPGQSTTVYQAENASFGGGAELESEHAGFNGTGYINFPASGGFIQFNNVNGGSGGSATLQFRYALGVSSSRTGQLVVNGVTQNITFNPTGAWTTWSTHSVTVSLNAGTGNTVRLQSNGQDLANIDQLTGPGSTTVTNTPTSTLTRTNTPIGPTATRTNTPIGPTNTPTRTPTQPSGSQVLQAEQASFGGGATADSNNAGFNGTGFINFPASGGFLQFNNVNGGSGGGATLQFRYALGVSGTRTGLLIVNGASQSITFQPSGAWTTWSTHTVSVNLNAGTGNTVRLETNGQDLANIDQLTVTAGGGPTPTRTNTPVGPTATRTNTPIGPTNTPTRTPTQPSGSQIFVAPNGSDSAPGTMAQPTTLTAAITRVQPGGTILMRGGTYNFSTPVIIARGNDGTSSARKQLFANPGETPVLNFSAMAEDPANRGLTVNGSFWHVRGLIVERAGDNGIFIGGSNNIVERCITRFNRDSGLQLSRHSSDAPFAEWPANNLILSCESHDNRDSDGEDADGFAPKLTVGEGNVFRFDVAHNNIDDGWDLFTKTDTGAIGRVRIEDSISFRNGTLSDGTTAGNGDRNGYKLGGEDIAVNHTVLRSLAFDNGKHGFTYNRNLGSLTITGNISIDNEERNFNFDGGSSVFRSNISCRSSSGTNDRIIGSDDGSNFFWMGSNTSSQCASFTGTFTWQFNADGSLSWSFR